jgi:hypothetical protein
VERPTAAVEVDVAESSVLLSGHKPYYVYNKPHTLPHPFFGLFIITCCSKKKVYHWCSTASIYQQCLSHHLGFLKLKDKKFIMMDL